MSAINGWTKPRTVFAFMFYITFCYLVIAGKDIHEELITIVSMLMGYYFGQKIGKAKKEEK